MHDAKQVIDVAVDGRCQPFHSVNFAKLILHSARKLARLHMKIATSRIQHAEYNAIPDIFMPQAAMWKHTVWPKLPPNKWEKDQPSKHDDALITLLWDQLVG